MDVEKAQKRLFRSLIREGVPPGTALELSGMAVRGETRNLRERISSLRGLSAETRKTVTVLCAGPF
jgi:hypothetical protein